MKLGYQTSKFISDGIFRFHWLKTDLDLFEVIVIKTGRLNPKISPTLEFLSQIREDSEVKAQSERRASKSNRQILAN